MIESNPGLKSEAEIRAEFKAITPASRPDMFATVTEHGESITYIPWHKCIEALDAVCPGYDYQILASDLHVADMPATTGSSARAARPGFGRVRTLIRLTIPTSDGAIVRDGQGYEPWEKEFYGDPYSNSEAMALRRALAKFGLGLSLYDKSQGGANAAYNGHAAAAPAQQPTAGQPTQQPTAAPATSGNPLKAQFPNAQDWKFKINMGANKGKYIFDPTCENIVADLEWHIREGKLNKKNPQTQQYDIGDTERVAIFQAEIARRQGSGVPATPPAPAQQPQQAEATVPAAGDEQAKVLPARVNNLAKAAKAIGVDYATLKAKCSQLTNGQKTAPTDLTNVEFDLVCLDVLGEPVA